MSYLSDLLGDAYKEGMTEEEISTALQSAGAGAKDNEAEVNRLKAQLSKANSEAADYKKQLRGKQSEDEAAAAEQKATMDKLTQENADLNLDSYDKVLITDDMSCPIDENTVLFVDSKPGYRQGKPAFDYTVKRVAKSLNTISYAVSKVKVS